MATVSCKKSFLTLYPGGNLNEGNYYKSVADLQAGLTAAYVPLRSVAGVAFHMDEGRADNTMYIYNTRDRGNATTENLENFLDAVDNPVTTNRWKYDYQGISTVNTLLDHMVNITFPIPDSTKNTIVGEAKALRGHYYFDLVRNFGGVPLPLHEVTTSAQAYLARSSADSVYGQIISDLSSADSLLNGPTFSTPQTGHITKGAVETELAAVYLQRSQFAEAIPYLKNVTTMGYSLYSNYRDIFNPVNKYGNKEIIWDVQYESGTTGQSSAFIYYFTPKTGSTKNILGVDFLNSSGGWNMPTQDLIQLFQPGDTRLEASIGVVEGFGNDGSTNYVAADTASIINYHPPTDTTVYYYYTKKYYYPPYPNINLNTAQDWPLYRYSDVLLMLAECYNETNDPNDALSYLNQVRFRAFGNSNGEITQTGQAALRDTIANERRRELCFENKRYQDLIRTGKAVSVLTAFGNAQKQKYSYMLSNSYNVTTDRLLYPIPYYDMTLNSLLVQNPGY